MQDGSSEQVIEFQEREIRRTWYRDEWYFSVVDVVRVLTDSGKPRDYWYRLKKRELETSRIQLSTMCRRLKLKSPDGKMRSTDCANIENLFRLIQSIPSKKAEPFKRWLARVGYERIQEIEDPDLLHKRMIEHYRSRGYSDEWIEKRIRGISVRQELTTEWEERGVSSGREYSTLTSDISRGTFDVTPAEYKELKGLESESLRDHMDDMELILTMFGEAATTRIHRERDTHGFPTLRTDAKNGGQVAGVARKAFEDQLGKSVISRENYLEEPEEASGRKRIQS